MQTHTDAKKFESLINSWFIVINPLAGGGKGKSDWPSIKNLLAKHGISYDYAFTEHKYHAVEITVKAINNGYSKIIAMGGDGTLNEVVNGIFIQKKIAPTEITVGVIAVGTGNDWFRMYSIPLDYSNCIQAIAKGKTFKQDIGRVEYYESMVQNHRYFANAAGVGFDAEVALRTNRLKEHGRRGAVLYMFSLLKALLIYRHTTIDIAIDDTKIHEKAFSLTLGIGRYNGAGMMQVPNAIANDGLFDITLIRKVSKLNVIWNIHRLYNGSILSHPKISSYQGRTIKISSSHPIKLEADGESLGESPFTFTIIPEAINVIVGNDFIPSKTSGKI